MANHIPALLARIQELEQALTPFARVAVAEQNNPQYNENILVRVYLKDCATALQQLNVPAVNVANEDGFFSQPAE